VQLEPQGMPERRQIGRAAPLGAVHRLAGLTAGGTARAAPRSSNDEHVRRRAPVTTRSTRQPGTEHISHPRGYPGRAQQFIRGNPREARESRQAEAGPVPVTHPAPSADSVLWAPTRLPRLPGMRKRRLREARRSGPVRLPLCAEHDVPPLARCLVDRLPDELRL
jgi:hypothetical protein